MCKDLDFKVLTASHTHTPRLSCRKIIFVNGHKIHALRMSLDAVSSWLAYRNLCPLPKANEIGSRAPMHKLTRVYNFLLFICLLDWKWPRITNIEDDQRDKRGSGDPVIKEVTNVELWSRQLSSDLQSSQFSSSCRLKTNSKATISAPFSRRCPDTQLWSLAHHKFVVQQTYSWPHWIWLAASKFWLHVQGREIVRPGDKNGNTGAEWDILSCIHNGAERQRTTQQARIARSFTWANS